MENFNKIMELTKGSSLSGDYDNKLYVSPENAGRTIYLADLPRNTSYMDICDFYESRVGPCQISIKRPLFHNFYFAFCQFQKLEHAQKALAEHRFPTIKGQKVRALPYSLNNSFLGTVAPGKKGEPAEDARKQIFVKGLPRAWDHEDLYAYFLPAGQITSAKVSISADFESRGYGFVEFKQLDSAVKAATQFNGKTVTAGDGDAQQTCTLVVTKFENKRQRTGREEPRCSANLYVKNFPQGGVGQDGSSDDGDRAPQQAREFNDSDLVELFRQFGEIVSARVMRDSEGNSKGFGFVCFADPADARRALDHFSKLAEEIRGGLYVCEAKSKEARQSEVAKKSYQFKKSMMYLNLILKNVDPSTTDEELSEHFSQFGSVNNVKVVPEASMAFVSFKDRESARAAKMSVQEVHFKGRFLFASFVEPKETRRLHFEEKMDKKAYERHQSSQFQSKNADFISLLTNLSFLFNQMNQVSHQRRANSAQMGHRPYQQQPLNGAPGAQVIGQPMGPQARHQQRPMHHQYQRKPYARGQSMQHQPHPQSQPQQQVNYSGPGPQPLMPASQSSLAAMQQHQPQPQQVSPPQHPNPSQQPMIPQDRGQLYQSEIWAMFNSPEFGQATIEARKEIIGTAIYKHVIDMVGEENAPKVTGMIIDLEPAELNMSIQTYMGLQQKVSSAMQLLVSNNLVHAPPSPPQQAHPAMTKQAVNV